MTWSLDYDYARLCEKTKVMAQWAIAAGRKILENSGPRPKTSPRRRRDVAKTAEVQKSQRPLSHSRRTGVLVEFFKLLPQALSQRSDVGSCQPPRPEAEAKVALPAAHAGG